MGNSTYLLVFVLFVNTLLFMSQLSMVDIALQDPDISNYNSCYSTSSGIIYFLASQQNSTINSNSDVSNQLLPEQEGISSGAINFFTDVTGSVLTWVKTVGAYIMLITVAPVSILNCVNITGWFVGLITALWYGFSLFILISWIKGGGD